MGFRRLTFLLSLTSVLVFAACGDNLKPVADDAAVEDDAAPDAPPDALVCGTAPNMNCNGTCVNTSTDNNNCGACGTTCDTGESCENGLCCPTGQENCNGACVDTTTSFDHCGACNDACTSGQTCMNSTCCGGSNTACPGGQCFNLEIDPNHCSWQGVCANACGQDSTGAGGENNIGKPFCSEGHCCPTGQIWCGPDVGGACVDVLSDEANCGACAGDTGSDVCDTGAGETCSNGLCCASGEINCGGQCVNTESDEANCGACAPVNGGNGDVCTSTETCLSGVCCANGLVNCNDVCVDLSMDEANCGGCAGTGGAEVCTTGETCTPAASPTPATNASCCGPGEINCNGACIDPITDSANCGNCAGVTGPPAGVACTAPNPVCSGGQCAATCLAPEINCNNDCIDPGSDHSNCGGCAGVGGVACAADEVCSAGMCITDCTGTDTECNGECVDTSSDPNHCGNCMTICSPNQECVNGTCQLDCPAGEVLCNGVCRNTLTDELACGACGAPLCTGTCDNGICCASGTIRCGMTCIDPTMDMNNCGGCTPPNGSTGDVCDPLTETCLPDGSGGGECCAPTDNVCGGACSNPNTDPNNCGDCAPANGGTGDICSGGETCDDGLCCGSGQENVNGLCCQTGFLNCSVAGTPTCFNPNTSNTNCGFCGNNCTNLGQVCVNGGCQAGCNDPLENSCGPCTNIDFDPDLCGTSCANCANGATCSDSACSPGNVANDDAADDGATPRVNDGCPASGQPETVCNEAVGAVVDNDGDGFFNDGCPQQGLLREGDEAGAGATCQDCPQSLTNPVSGPANGCSGTCTNWLTDNANCGSCGNVCTGGTVCTSGVCCAPGLIKCGNTGTPADCVDPNSNEANCGGCSPSNGGAGEVCVVGQLCVNGDCGCPFGQIACQGNCVTPSVDPANCGACGNVCGLGTNLNKPYCVSNGCTAVCPAPLLACDPDGDGDGTCINPDSDSANCGGCEDGPGGSPGVACNSNQGCVDGVCRNKFPLTPDSVLYPLLTTRCEGGGPPISVPTLPNGGGQTCTGNIAGTAFTFGMCSRTQIDVPAQIFTDAFNSRFGPYVPVGTFFGANKGCDAPNLCVGGPTPGATCFQDSTCGTGGNCESVDCPGGAMCLGAPSALDPKVCIGGGVGVNGPAGSAPIVKTSQSAHVGGSFWAWGEIGLDMSKAFFVKEKTYNQGPFKYADTGSLLYGDAFIDGAWSYSGNPSLTLGVVGSGTGHLTTDPTVSKCPANGGVLNTKNLTLNDGCTEATWATVVAVPGGGELPAPCGEESDLQRDGGWDIPVTTIVEYFRNPANNDNKAIGLPYNAITGATAPVRLDLPCGYYYLDSMQGNQPVTIVVEGRVGLFIGGAADINVEMIFDVKPTGSLDIFIGGIVNIAHSITLGSPAYPRLTRMYIGSASVDASGDPCQAVSDCAGGLCSACPQPNASFVGYGACTGTGTCSGVGTGRSPAINMSQGGYFNGLLWAGYGGFSTSNSVEMYGAIFANSIGASGALKIHYDNGAVGNDECPPPPPGTQLCESCRDCFNQPCGSNGTCQATCTADNECCPPLTCQFDSGTGTKRCKL